MFRFFDKTQHLQEIFATISAIVDDSNVCATPRLHKNQIMAFYSVTNTLFVMSKFVRYTRLSNTNLSLHFSFE